MPQPHTLRKRHQQQGPPTPHERHGPPVPRGRQLLQRHALHGRARVLGEKLARELFRSDWASLRPLSGHSADMIMISTLTRPGGSILSVNPADGGYPGISDKGYPPFVDVKNLYFPFDSERMNIDTDKSKTLIEEKKPSLVVFGQSFFLFPHPVRELIQSCRSAGSEVAFDASHVVGLIAGGQFQN